MKLRKLHVLSSLLSILLFSASVFGQGTIGTITGQVMDPSGAAIPGTRVVALNVATNVATPVTSTSTGDYTITVYPGTYRLTAESDGFKRIVRDNVIVSASATVRADLTMELGAVSESVSVEGAALSVQTENAKVTTAVENRMIDELPLVVGGALRSPFDLVKIAAQANGEGTNLRLGGGQTGAWDATLDGVSITTNRSADTTEISYTAPSLEAITDFAVDTNGFKAEFGQAGGGVMTFSSKSGTNDFHGSVFDFLRNEKLDARAFFAAERSVYKQNDFGASGGGPIWIPKLYNGRNRSFFFAAYEGFRNRVGANDRILSVPTPEMYNGDFSNWVNQSGQVLQIYDPRTTRRNASGTGFVRDPFPNNQIPQAALSSFSKALIPFGQVLKPNRGGQPGTIDYVRNNYLSTGGSILDPQNKWSLKLDHLVSQNHRVGFFMNFSDFNRAVGPGGPPGFQLPLWDGNVQTFTTSAYRVSYDWIVSPTIVNHFSIGGNKFVKTSASPNDVGGWKSTLCFKNVIDCDRNFPTVTFTEFSQWGQFAANGTEQPTWAINNDLSWTKGKHTMKFGFAFQDQIAIGVGEQQISGSAGFSFLSTSVPGQTSFNSGSSFASFLLGDALSGGTETIRRVEQIYKYFGFYAQDDWRITPRLTLNLGIRYDYTSPPVEGKDEYSDFTPDKPNPAVNGFPGALRFAGFGDGREGRRSLVEPWRGGIGPRVGLAYQLNSKTTLRAAVGRSFSKVTVVSGSGHFYGFIGQYRFNSTDQGVTPAFNWDNGLPSYPLPPDLNPAFQNNQNVDYWQLSDATRAPENFFWTFTMQRQLSNNTVLEVGYNATIGAHLQAGLVNINQVPTSVWNSYVSRLGAQAAVSLFNSDINSTVARANNVPIPYPNFTDSSVQQRRSVAQALRPYPQYLNINTGAQGGDKSGHSSYHSMVLRLQRRYQNGLALDWNYVFSKLITDADEYRAGNNQSMDQYNRRLEKSIGEFDQTHVFKMSTVYELPFGRGKKFLSNSNGFVNAVLGGWRLAGIQVYQSGLPIALARNNPLPIFNGFTRPTISTYENWRAPLQGNEFDPQVDRFLDKNVFPAQPIDFGNATRHNPKVRSFAQYNENISLGKTFQPVERLRIDFRAEAFNLFNRVIFGTGSTNLNANNFGIVANQVNDPRQMQLGLKLYW